MPHSANQQIMESDIDRNAISVLVGLIPGWKCKNSWPADMINAVIPR
jgi:hypothetical protein